MPEDRKIYKGVMGEPVYKGPSWFRTFITIWIIVFTLITLLALRNISHTSAREIQLEKTNCGLKQFLLAARNVRIDAARHDTGQTRLVDLRAAHGYLVLANRFVAVGRCKLPPTFIYKPPAKRRDAKP